MEQTIAERITNILAEQFEIVAADIKPEMRLAEDLGADSLDTVELTIALEDEFEIEVSDEESEATKTVQQAIDLVTAKLA